MKKLFIIILLLFSCFSFLQAQQKEDFLKEDISSINPSIDREEYFRLIEEMSVTRFNKEMTISFVSNGGLLKENEHAIVSYIDAELLLPAIMLSYQYGLSYWLTIGIDVGGNYGLFQALLKIKMEMLRLRSSDLFFLGWNIRTGFKHHEVKLSDNLNFSDLSYVIIFENTLALRFGRQKKEQRQVLYLNTEVYFDFDLHRPSRQIDYYIAPAVLGFETLIGRYGNLFIEAGAMLSLNGMETGSEVLYDNQWFPIGKIGFAVRTGFLTADIYTDPGKLKNYSKP